MGFVGSNPEKSALAPQYEKFHPDAPTELNISNRRNKANEYHSLLNRLPTFGEVLARKTQSPVDLGTFYIFMDQHEGAIDYLDFWLEVMHHLTLCKHYVKGLRESVIRNSLAHNLQQALKQIGVTNLAHNSVTLLNYQSPQMAGYRNLGSASASPHRESIPLLEHLKRRSLSLSLLLDMIVNDQHLLEETDSHRLSQFLRGELSLDNNDPRVRELMEEYKRENPDAALISQEQQQQLQYPDQYVLLQPPSTLGGGGGLTDQELMQILDNYPHKPVNSSAQNSERPISTALGEQSIVEQGQIGHANVASMTSNPKYVQYPSGISQDTGDDSIHLIQPPPPASKLYSNKINPSFLEKLIRDLKMAEPGEELSSKSFVTREHLRESSHNLLLKYFVEDAEKKIAIPKDLNEFIVQAIERDGRDDPDVFSGVRNYVFKLMESELFPKFLQMVAIQNITEFSSRVRIVVGLVLLFFAFWISFILLFLNYAKHTRAVVVVPFIFAFYLIVSAIYYIDPILVFLGFSESFDRKRYLFRIQEPFVRKLLVKRAIWVTFLICILTAAMTLIFSLVPGHRL